MLPGKISPHFVEMTREDRRLLSTVPFVPSSFYAVALVCCFGYCRPVTVVLSSYFNRSMFLSRKSLRFVAAFFHSIVAFFLGLKRCHFEFGELSFRAKREIFHPRQTLPSHGPRDSQPAGSQVAPMLAQTG